MNSKSVLLFAAVAGLSIASAAMADPPAPAQKSVNRTAPSPSPKSSAPIYRNTGELKVLTDATTPPAVTLLLPQRDQIPELAAIPSKRIAIDVNNARIDDALKKLFAQVGLRYELDKEIPANTRVTLRVRNVSFTSALQILLEQANLGWTVTTAEPSNTGRSIYKIGKQYASIQWLPLLTNPDLNLNNIPWKGLSGHSLLIPWSNYTNSNHNNWNAPYYYWELGNRNQNEDASQPVTPLQYTLTPQIDSQKTTIEPIYTPLPGIVTTNKIPVLSELPLIGRLFTTTVRTEHSIFTCPHCHEQITVVRTHETPTCPECGRAFQTDWKVCPFDGAKRPVVAGEWQFCPICGKAIGAAPPKRSGANRSREEAPRPQGR